MNSKYKKIKSVLLPKPTKEAEAKIIEDLNIEDPDLDVAMAKIKKATKGPNEQRSTIRDSKADNRKNSSS